jgi:integrase
MSQEIIPHTSMEALSLEADNAARKTVLARYMQTKSGETLRRQGHDIALFEEYLLAAGHTTSGMKDDLSLWRGVSYGIVAGFQQWQLNAGHAIGSINVRVTTVKRYCELANQAGHIASEEIEPIRSIVAIAHKEGRNIDGRRAINRVGEKKAKAVLLSETHVELIKKKLSQDSPRNYLLFCLLADLGLRCGEVADIQTKDLDLTTGMLVFYRRKVDKTQTHRLSKDALEAAQNYIGTTEGKLFKGNPHKGTGKTSMDGITTRGINKIVRQIGELVGVGGLSPHDLRHYWATTAVRKGTDIKALQQAGGWNSPAMPLRYAEESEIANEGVKL